MYSCACRCRALHHLFNDTVVPQIEALYPAASYKSQDKRLAALFNDYVFLCASRRVARSISSFGVPTYIYHFAYPLDWIEGHWVGDYHTSELPFVFGNPWPVGVHHFTAKDKYISNLMETYWTSMAKFQNPNADSR